MSVEEVNIKSAGDGGKDLLGFEYDLLYALGDNYKGAKNPVINIEAFEQNKPLDPLTGDPYTKFLPKGKIEVAMLHGNATEYETFGYSLEDFYKNTAMKLTSNTSTLISFGKIQFSVEFDNTISNKESYSFYKKDICRNVKRLYFSTFSPTRLKYYLTEEFIFAIQNYTAEEILQDFGTHVLVDIYVGGKLSALVSAKTKSSSSTEVQKFTSDFFDMIKTKNKDSIVASSLLENITLTMVQHGGKKVETVNLKLTSGGAIDRSVFNWQEWLNSVDETSSYLIHSYPNTLIPIYSFIFDSKLKQEVIDLIKERAKQNPAKPYEPEEVEKIYFEGKVVFAGGGGQEKVLKGYYPKYIKKNISTTFTWDSPNNNIYNLGAVRIEGEGSASIQNNRNIVVTPTKTGPFTIKIHTTSSSQSYILIKFEVVD